MSQSRPPGSRRPSRGEEDGTPGLHRSGSSRRPPPISVPQGYEPESFASRSSPPSEVNHSSTVQRSEGRREGREQRKLHKNHQGDYYGAPRSMQAAESTVDSQFNDGYSAISRDLPSLPAAEKATRMGQPPPPSNNAAQYIYVRNSHIPNYYPQRTDTTPFKLADPFQNNWRWPFSPVRRTAFSWHHPDHPNPNIFPQPSHFPPHPHLPHHGAPATGAPQPTPNNLEAGRMVNMDPTLLVPYHRIENPYSLVTLLSHVPKTLYTLVLLGLPAVYWRRTQRILEGQSLNKATVSEWLHGKLPEPDVLSGITQSWERFLDAHLEEWKTLNVVSVLLCGALLAVLQIEDAAHDPFLRWTALFSIIFAITSLTYGCIYVIHFTSMRSAAPLQGWVNWLVETESKGTNPFWNPYIVLASPAIWLAWAMIMFCIIIVSFAWRTNSAANPPQKPVLPARNLLAARIMLTIFLGISCGYFVLILCAFSSRIHRDVRASSSTVQAASGSPVTPSSLGSARRRAATT